MALPYIALQFCWNPFRSALRAGPQSELKQPRSVRVRQRGSKYCSTTCSQCSKTALKKRPIGTGSASLGTSPSKKRSEQSYLQNYATWVASSLGRGKLEEVLFWPGVMKRCADWRERSQFWSRWLSLKSWSRSLRRGASFARRARQCDLSSGRERSKSSSSRGITVDLNTDGPTQGGLPVHSRRRHRLRHWRLWVGCSPVSPSVPASPTPTESPASRSSTPATTLTTRRRPPRSSSTTSRPSSTSAPMPCSATAHSSRTATPPTSSPTSRSHQYKMHLLHHHANARAVDGRQMPLLLVVRQTLRYLARQATQRLQEQLGTVISPRIRWVVTVPALWDEQHKQFMRRAAVQAGLVDQLNSPSLLLCLQPEGASIQCREDAESSVRGSLRRGTVVLVLDCGGGTVDITVHKLQCQPEERFLCKELLPSSGGCQWGSRYVDQYFEEFLKQFLGDELWRVYMRNALARLDVLRDFQLLKRKFKGGKDERSVVKLSYLSEHLTARGLQDLVARHNSGCGPELQLRVRGSSNLELPGALMRSFFQPLFENIKSKVHQLVKQAQERKEHVDFIFMVGGFSQSPFLKAEVVGRFQPLGMQVLVPRRPQVSVVRGACLYGLNPRSISSRVAKRTYGINTLTCFDPERHPERKKVVIEGEDFCQDVFDPFVRKGDSVSVDEVHTKVYCPVRARQTVMRVIFYVTDRRDVQFIDEPGVGQLGELCVDIGKALQSVEEKTVRVTLRFGSTQVWASASNKDGSEERTCEFRFDCNS